MIGRAKARVAALEKDKHMNLNSDVEPHDVARALHRVVRAMHDGECPQCHSIFSSGAMREAYHEQWQRLTELERGTE